MSTPDGVQTGDSRGQTSDRVILSYSKDKNS